MDDKKPHDIIYLQWNDEYVSEDEGVTWCKDSINDTDIMYIRHDLHLAEIKRLQKIIESFIQTCKDTNNPITASAIESDYKQALKE